MNHDGKAGRSFGLSGAPRRALVAAMVGAGLVVGLVACDQGDGVASLGVEGGSSPASAGARESAVAPGDDAAAQAAAAESMVECLGGAGLAAAAEALEEPGWRGQKSLRLKGPDPWAVSYGTGEPRLVSPDAGSAEEVSAALERLRPLLREHGAEDTLDALVSGGPREIQMPGTEPDAAESPPAFLIVGDADHTELLQGCIKETGYVEPVFYADPAEELKEKQATLEATLAWIECARQNGYPDIRDPAAPVADQRITTPTAVLPLETTTQDLERLLSECPADVGDASLDGIIVSAEIGFDAPGFRGDLSEDAEIEPETADRLVALQNIIAESVSAH